MTHTCEKCGNEYEEYTVFVPEDMVDSWRRRKSEYEHLCEPCNDEWFEENA